MDETTFANKSVLRYFENSVKTQVWIAISVYVLVAIIKKRLNLDHSLYTILQIFFTVVTYKRQGILTQPKSRMSIRLPAFQSSSSPKAGCYPCPVCGRMFGGHVSILIQPEGWMLFACVGTYFCPLTVFNPHPARRLDAMRNKGAHDYANTFQSSSSPKAGCYWKAGVK